MANQIPDWMIGQIGTIAPGQFLNDQQSFTFYSSGFLFKTKKYVFFITTLHTRRKVRNSDKLPFYVYLPNVPSGVKKLYSITAAFAVEEEDAEVFGPIALDIVGDYVTQYHSPKYLAKGSSLIAVGYPALKLSEKSNQLTMKLIAFAILNNDRSNIVTEIKTMDDTWEIFASGNISLPGMSGSPVFETETGNLVGILKGFGDDKNDPRVSEILGVKTFNILRPLDRTIAKLIQKYGE